MASDHKPGKLDVEVPLPDPVSEIRENYKRTKKFLGEKTTVNDVFELAYIFLATFLVSLISFVGVICLALKETMLNKILLILIGLSAGAFMGGAFLHLLPEAVGESNGLDVYLFVLIGFIIFFLIEKVLLWRHCHKGECDVHPAIRRRGIHLYRDDRSSLRDREGAGYEEIHGDTSGVHLWYPSHVGNEGRLRRIRII